MKVARLQEGVVVNVEMADDDWLITGANGDLLIPYTDDAPARIGDIWDGNKFIPPATTE